MSTIYEEVYLHLYGHIYLHIFRGLPFWSETGMLQPDPEWLPSKLGSKMSSNDLEISENKNENCRNNEKIKI